MVKVHQLLAGRDFALGDSSMDAMAAQMANYVYLVALDDDEREFVVVDAAWDVEGILAFARKQGLTKPKGAVFTHRHLDHTGGTVRLARQSVSVPGLAHFVNKGLCPVYVGKDDVEATAQQTGVAADSIRALEEGMTLFGCMTVISTPGHTPGSVCFRVLDEYLISGDTLFIGACGRVDLQESDPDQMDKSLARLSRFPDALKVLPGHNYAPDASSTIARERATNVMMRMALQASGALRPSPTSAVETVRLPDYLGAAYAALREAQ